MSENKRPGLMRAYVIAFIVLTSLCWCPWAYGFVTGRAGAIPGWAVLAYVFASGLFVLEWVFLFFSHLAVNDEDLPRIISQLEAVGGDDPAGTKEGQ